MNEFILVIIWFTGVHTQELIGKTYCEQVSKEMKSKHNIVDAYCIPKRGKN